MIYSDGGKHQVIKRNATQTGQKLSTYPKIPPCEIRSLAARL